MSHSERTHSRTFIAYSSRKNRALGRGSLRMGSQIWSSQHNLWPLDGRAVALLVTCCSATVHIHRANIALNSLPLTALGFATEWRQIMTLRKALLAAAVLVLSVPVVPALPQDADDNGYSSHARHHTQFSTPHQLPHQTGSKTAPHPPPYHT